MKMFRMLSAVVVFVFFGACQTTPRESGAAYGGQHSGSSNDIAGHYELIRVSGVLIPGKVRHGSHEIVVHSGSFQINADGCCRSTTVFSPPHGERLTRTVDASFTRSGSRLVMRWKGAGVTEGEISGEFFTMDNHGMFFRYQRIDEKSPAGIE